MKNIILLTCILSFSCVSLANADTDKNYTDVANELANESLKAAVSGKTTEAYEKMQHSTTHFVNGVTEQMSGNGKHSECSGCYTTSK